MQSDPNHSETGIKIMVTDPLIKDAVQKYVVYCIKGSDKDSPFEVYRRYSNFAVLRVALVKRWPGCFIPPLPEKKTLGNLDPKFIEDRRRHLEKFCSQMAELPHLFYSEEFKIFLKQNHADLEKVLSSLPQQTCDDVIQKYQAYFSHLSGKEINTELVMKINGFANFLKKISVMLGNFKDMAKNTGKSRRNFNEQFNTFSNFLMPEYEKNCFSEYVCGNPEKLIFANPNETKLTYLLNLMKDNHTINSFEELADMLKAEFLDTNAFLEALSMKALYEQNKDKTDLKLKDLQLDLQKIMSGKTTLGSLFSNKEEKITSMEKQITNTKAELENYQFLCDIITVIVGYIEVDRFKKEKQEKYYKLLKCMAQTEIEYARGMQEYWIYVGENKNLEAI